MLQLSTGLGFRQRTIEQIRDVEVCGPPAKVGHIQPLTLNVQDALNIIPLTFRYLAALPIPVKFGQDDVFCAGDKGLAVGWRQHLKATPFELATIKLPVTDDEDIDLEHGGAMNQVEAASVDDCRADHVRISIKLFVKPVDKLGDVFDR